MIKREFLYLIGNDYLSKKINIFFGLNYDFIFLKNHKKYPMYPEYEDIQIDFFNGFREAPILPKILFLSNPNKNYYLNNLNDIQSLEKIKEIYFNNLNYLENLTQKCQIFYGNSFIIKKRFSYYYNDNLNDFQSNFIYLNKIYFDFFKTAENFKNLMIPYIIDKDSIKDLLKIKESLPARIYNGYKIPEEDLNKEIEILSLDNFLKEIEKILLKSFSDIPYEINFKDSEIITLKEFQEKVLKWIKDTKDKER